MHKILFVDCETTGLEPDVNGVHQIAGQIVISGKIVEEFNLQFKPMESEKIEPEALAVSGLERKDLDSREMESRRAYTVFDKMMCTHVDKFNKNDKMVIAGYNCNFDAQFLNAWYRKHGNRYFFGLCHGGAYLDGLTLAIMAEIKLGRRLFLPDRKLGTVAKCLGVPLDNAHDALADIRATKAVISELWRIVTK